jgi:hypothetical protein
LINFLFGLHLPELQLPSVCCVAHKISVLFASIWQSASGQGSAEVRGGIQYASTQHVAVAYFNQVALL